MTHREVINLLESAGFTVTQAIPFQFGLNRVYVAAGNEHD